MDRRRQFPLLAGALLLLAVAAGLGLRHCSGNRDQPTPTATAVRATAPTPGTDSLADHTTSGAPALRLRSLVLDFGPSGLRLREATSLPGRAKAPPRSTAPDRLEFVALDAAGRPIHTGSIDHPLHRRFEVESTVEPGRLEGVQTSVPADLVHLRLPETPRAVTLQFFEVRAGRPGRTPLGEIGLP